MVVGYLIFLVRFGYYVENVGDCLFGVVVLD